MGSVTPVTEWWPSWAGVMAIGGAGASVGTTHHLALRLRRVRRTSEVPPGPGSVGIARKFEGVSHEKKRGSSHGGDTGGIPRNPSFG